MPSYTISPEGMGMEEVRRRIFSPTSVGGSSDCPSARIEGINTAIKKLWKAREYVKESFKDLSKVEGLDRQVEEKATEELMRVIVARVDKLIQLDNKLRLKARASSNTDRSVPHRDYVFHFPDEDSLELALDLVYECGGWLQSAGEGENALRVNVAVPQGSDFDDLWRERFGGSTGPMTQPHLVRHDIPLDSTATIRRRRLDIPSGMTWGQTEAEANVESSEFSIQEIDLSVPVEDTSEEDMRILLEQDEREEE